MKVVIPMAGRGTRLRPHTLNIPKPLLKLCGKTIIEWIVEEIKDSTSTGIEEIHYIIGDFGDEVEKELLKVAEKIGSTGFIHYQTEALGTAHALYCAADALHGEVFVAFADTIFKGKISIDEKVDGMIWTMLVENPEKYGVVKTNEEGIITDFIEKPKKFVSKNAIVGLYYFRKAEDLLAELQFLIDNNLRENNEFQLTNCLESLKEKENKLKCAELDEWLDCGTKDELLNTNRRLIELNNAGTYYCDDSVVIDNTSIEYSVSIDSGVSIQHSKLKNCIVYKNSTIKNCELTDSIVGENCIIENYKGRIFAGDYTELYNE